MDLESTHWAVNYRMVRLAMDPAKAVGPEPPERLMVPPTKGGAVRAFLPADVVDLRIPPKQHLSDLVLRRLEGRS
jgi:hypothetical protein